MNKTTIAWPSRILVALGALALFASLFVPLWRIELDAPQYPEGLALQIFPHKLGGDVEIINGLNHYIGMQTLHAEKFIEFTVLPYIIGFFALLLLANFISARRKLLFYTFWLFVIFGIVAMADFWRWEYNYGHNLDPSAAIIVPGQSYQPPLIGFKQLLNFGAYSIPDIGGWLFLFTGLFLLLAVGLDRGWFMRRKMGVTLAVGLAPVLLFLSACDAGGPEPLVLNRDKCDFCKMSISDGRFGSELITAKGRAYKFDDLYCLVNYSRQNQETKVSSYWVNDYSAENVLIEASSAHFVQHVDLNSPMGGNWAAFIDKQEAEAAAVKFGAGVQTWYDVLDKTE